MAEYVEKSKMKQYVKNFFIGLKVDGDKFDEEDCCETICQIIDFSPAADVVEVKHAYWKLLILKGGRRSGQAEAKCSICGRDAVYQITEDKWEFENHCPHCGAKMDGGNNA